MSVSENVYAFLCLKDKEAALYYKQHCFLDTDISGAFIWDATPQGGSYWSTLHNMYRKWQSSTTPKGNRRI